jgi:hypothetical protein
MLSPAPIQTSSLSTITSSTASPDAGPNSRASATARFCASKRRGAACGAAAGSSSSMTNGSAAQLPARRGRLRSRSSLALARGACAQVARQERASESQRPRKSRACGK